MFSMLQKCCNGVICGAHGGVCAGSLWCVSVVAGVVLLLVVVLVVLLLLLRLVFFVVISVLSLTISFRYQCFYFNYLENNSHEDPI